MPKARVSPEYFWVLVNQLSYLRSIIVEKALFRGAADLSVSGSLFAPQGNGIFFWSKNYEEGFAICN